MITTKLNHGYVLHVHFFFRDGQGTTNQTRYFGPFLNPIVALDTFEKDTRLKIDWTIRNGTKRPVLGFKYPVKFSKNGIVAVSVSTLETELHLANLKNPKD